MGTRRVRRLSHGERRSACTGLRRRDGRDGYMLGELDAWPAALASHCPPDNAVGPVHASHIAQAAAAPSHSLLPASLDTLACRNPPPARPLPRNPAPLVRLLISHAPDFIHDEAPQRRKEDGHAAQDVAHLQQWGVCVA